MGNILLIYENEMPTIQMMKEGISRPGSLMYGHSMCRSVRNVSAGDINQSDVIIFLRPCDVFSYIIAKICSVKNRFIITYCDDDLYDLQDETPLGKKRQLYFRKVLALSQTVWTCSPRIADKYRRFTKENRAAVSGTVIDPEQITEHRDGNEKVKIVYAAGQGHAQLFEKYVGPVLEDLQRETKNGFSLTFVGVAPKVNALQNELDVTYVPLMPLEKYREYMKSQNFDIGLAPIEDDEFSKCKYFNKFLEYSTYGILGIYSGWEPYTYVVKDQENGLLAGRDSREWLQAMVSAINDEQLRRRCAAQAQKILLEDFTEEKSKANLAEAIPELADRSPKSTKTGPPVIVFTARIIYNVNRVLLFCRTSAEYAHRNGVRALLQKIRNHIRERNIYS